MGTVPIAISESTSNSGLLCKRQKHILTIIQQKIFWQLAEASTYTTKRTCLHTQKITHALTKCSTSLSTLILLVVKLHIFNLVHVELHVGVSKQTTN